MENEEWFDVVDEAGIPTGKTVSRREAHDKGILHRTAHVWIIRTINGITEILLQKRSDNKDSFPGMYDTSSAGHIPACSEPMESAIRELQEELGITAVPQELTYAGMFRIQYEKEFHGHRFCDNEVAGVYIYEKPVDINSLILQESEVSDVRWFSLWQVYEEIQHDRSRFCVPREGLECLIQYLKKQQR